VPLAPKPRPIGPKLSPQYNQGQTYVLGFLAAADLMDQPISEKEK